MNDDVEPPDPFEEAQWELVQILEDAGEERVDLLSTNKIDLEFNGELFEFTGTPRWVKERKAWALPVGSQSFAEAIVELTSISNDHGQYSGEKIDTPRSIVGLYRNSFMEKASRIYLSGVNKREDTPHEVLQQALGVLEKGLLLFITDAEVLTHAKETAIYVWGNVQKAYSSAESEWVVLNRTTHTLANALATSSPDLDLREKVVTAFAQKYGDALKAKLDALASEQLKKVSAGSKMDEDSIADSRSMLLGSISYMGLHDSGKVSLFKYAELVVLRNKFWRNDKRAWYLEQKGREKMIADVDFTPGVITFKNSFKVISFEGKEYEYCKRACRANQLLEIIYKNYDSGEETIFAEALTTCEVLDTTTHPSKYLIHNGKNNRDAKLNGLIWDMFVFEGDSYTGYRVKLNASFKYKSED